MSESWFGSFWEKVRRLFGGQEERVDWRVERRSRPRPPYVAPDLPAPPAAPPAVPFPVDPERQRRADRAKLIAAFNAAQPVSDRYELSGRTSELAKLVEHVVERHSHAIIHGPRGSGKTSLARIFGDVADEGGCIALYQATTGDIDFAGLMQPYLEEIRLHIRKGLDGQPEELGEGFGARQFAAAVADLNCPLLLLILDEFDRIESKTTRDEVAALMKLLSDIRSPVRLVVVGIAATVDDVIAAHPSLRRHLVALALTPISEASVMRLIREGGQRAGLTYSESARELIASIALGSPYHVRLFCLNGGLAAINLGDREVGRQAMEEGLRTAYGEWAIFNPSVEDLALTLQDQPQPVLRALKSILVLAARKHSFSDEDVSRAITGSLAGEGNADELKGPVIDFLMPLLSRSGSHYSFKDTLAPQFLLLRLSIPFNNDLVEEVDHWGV